MFDWLFYCFYNLQLPLEKNPQKKLAVEHQNNHASNTGYEFLSFLSYVQRGHQLPDLSPSSDILELLVGINAFKPEEPKKGGHENYGPNRRHIFLFDSL